MKRKPLIHRFRRSSVRTFQLTGEIALFPITILLLLIAIPFKRASKIYNWIDDN